jgi:hypothetical protein
MNNLPHALAYGADALPVLPLAPGLKVPAIKGGNGFYDATTNPETIKRFWRIPDRNIGVPTGIASGFWVLDIDPPRGEQEIHRLQAEHAHDPLPPTRTVITPRGGRHLWFKYTGPVPSSIGKIASNIDVKADGGYVVVAPSITVDGAYSWSSDPKAPLAIAPQWLVDLARKKPRPTISQRAVAGINHGGRNGAYGQAALDRECAALAAIASGGRNNALNPASFRLHQLVAGGELHRNEVVERLLDSCHRNHLIEDDGLRSVEATIRSGANAGLQYPRSRKGAI